jgi:hypothetical protein
MITIANARAEKAARKLAKQLDTTISEAVAVACERVLMERDAVTRGKRARSQLDRVLTDIWKQHERPASAEARSRLADHAYLYGDDGLPR